MLSQKENALRTIRFDAPEYVMAGLPSYPIGYKGSNHEGHDEIGEHGHNCAVGTKWFDIWGTGWVKEHADVMGFPKYAPLAEPENLKHYTFPDPDDERVCAQIYEQKKGYGGGDCFLAENKMALCGGISTGAIMQGPEEQIEAAVKDAIYALGQNGGYFCSPDQGMPFPEKHIQAYRDALEKYGRYPLV